MKKKKNIKNDKKNTIKNIILFVVILILINISYISYNTGIIQEATSLMTYSNLSSSEIEEKYASNISHQRENIEKEKEELSSKTVGSDEYNELADQIEKEENIMYFVAITNDIANKKIRSSLIACTIFDVTCTVIYVLTTMYLRKEKNK